MLRNWWMANQGKDCELRSAVYKCNSEIVLADAIDLRLYLAGGTIHGVGYHKVFRFLRTQGVVLRGVDGARSTILGSHPQPGYFEFGPEHAHAVSLEATSDVELAWLLMKNNQGDGVYLDHYNAVFAKDVWVRDSRVESNGRMGIAVCGGENLLAERMEYHNTAWSPIDIEPEWYGKYVGTKQGAVNCRFLGGKVTGWVGAGPITGNGAVFFYSGTPHTTGGHIPPIVRDIEVADHVVDASALRGLWANVDGNGYRQAGIKFLRNRSQGVASAPFIGNPVRLARVDGATITGNHQDVTNGTTTFVGSSSSTGVSSSGNTGQGITGQGG
jgi:hypothetical protein